MIISCCKDPVMNQSGFNGKGYRCRCSSVEAPRLKNGSVHSFHDYSLPETEVKGDLLANTRGGILPSYIYTPEIYHR